MAVCLGPPRITSSPSFARFKQTSSCQTRLADSLGAHTLFRKDRSQAIAKT